MLISVQLVCGDVYLHIPRGSNNRLNEQSAERANANRVFDSQVRHSLPEYDVVCTLNVDGVCGAFTPRWSCYMYTSFLKEQQYVHSLMSPACIRVDERSPPESTMRVLGCTRWRHQIRRTSYVDVVLDVKLVTIV